MKGYALVHQRVDFPERVFAYDAASAIFVNARVHEAVRLRAKTSNPA
jgi:hypothetical protein